MVFATALVASFFLAVQVEGLPPAAPENALVVEAIEPGPGHLGSNLFRIDVSNAGTEPVTALLSLRVESPSRAGQRSHYRRLAPGERAAWTEAYDVPGRAYRLLRVYVGVATAAPTEAEPYPTFAGEPEHWTFVLFPDGSGTGSPPVARTTWQAYWDFGEPLDELTERIAAVADSLSADDHTRTLRLHLRSLLSTDRLTGTNDLDGSDYRATELHRDSLGPYRIRTMRIAGEPSAPIEFQLLRRDGYEGPLPTVLYLTGNPPGTKESGTVPGMLLADRGLQVVSVDRRETARSTETGEFLDNIADPVYDAHRVLDFLASRPDLTDGLSVFGFSAGAYEAMHLLVLHPDVTAGVLASRMVDHDSLFASEAWIPTLYAPEVLADVGLGDHLKDFWGLIEAATPEHGRRAALAYRERYPDFDLLNPRHVLPLAAPRPVLVLTGALDDQFPLNGVLAVGEAVRSQYAELGGRSLAQLHVMTNSGHQLTAVGLSMVGAWLELWTSPGEGAHP